LVQDHQDLRPQEKVKKGKAASHAREGTPPRRSSLQQNSRWVGSELEIGS
jgi:hypothetical protein